MTEETGQTNNVQPALTFILDRFGLTYGAALAADGSVYAQAGKTSEEILFLRGSLLGRDGSAVRTFATLDEVPLPQVSSHGRIFAILDRPTDSMMVAVFGKHPDGPSENRTVELERLAEQISKAIQSAFGSMVSAESGPVMPGPVPTSSE